MVTRDEFIAEYCNRSGVTKEVLLAWPGVAIRECDCESELCEGWAIVFEHDLRLERLIGAGFSLQDASKAIEVVDSVCTQCKSSDSESCTCCRDD